MRDFWLSLWFLAGGLQRWGPGNARPAERPAATVTGRLGRTVLVQPDRPARAREAGPRHDGGTAAETRLRVPELELLPEDAAGDVRALRALVHRFRALTPRLARNPRDGLLLEVRGSFGLFGGRAGLLEEVRRRLVALGPCAPWGSGPTPAATRLAARFGTSDPARRPLLDVLTCIRERCTLEEAGTRLARNAERRLLAPYELEARFRDLPEAVAATEEVLERCHFSLDALRYDYPVAEDDGGRTPQQELERRVWKGAARRWPGGIPEGVRRRLRHELRVVGELGYAPYFLTVHDIVRFAESRGILCQGRGSAANSVICYALGITHVDPERIDLLFERFVSAARREPPDIDVDFERERREEVIRWVFERYGREHAAMVAVVVCWRWKLALREVARVFGLSAEVQETLARACAGTGPEGPDRDTLRRAGLDPDHPTLRRVLHLAGELVGLPRHLSQHPGGMVISRSPLCELVPVTNAAMAGRTVIEWDKDDLDALGLLKIDLLALGMLSCLYRAFDLLRTSYSLDLDLARIPPEDPEVYAMLSRGDALGVFQVESRAQLAMLPRLKPRGFYDLVVQVAIVRPGPIQGEMVHPYLRRRLGEEPVTFPSKELEAILGRTLGVPLFQEQAMRIAIRAAGFSPEEAEGLRRAMATFRRRGDVARWRERFVEGMVRRGYARDFAERCFRQIEGFGSYGFPESHAASFALLVYASAWIKCHFPDVFLASILNAQPMGFYAPA